MIRLVPYDRTYLTLSKKWLSDDETNRLVNAGAQPSDEEREKWFSSLPNKSDYIIWGVEYNEEPVGACGLKHIKDGRAEWWMYIGEKSLWGKGLGGQILKELLKEVQIYGIKELYMSVQKSNVRCVSLHDKYGFVVTSEDDKRLYMSKFID